MAGNTNSLRPVALLGHAHTCPIKGHGTGTIVSASETSTVNGRGIARVGDKISCGATIISGSASTTIDGGRSVARKGDRTDHGGVIIEGDDTWPTL